MNLWRALLAVLAACAWIVGCGLKGPLIPPQKSSEIIIRAPADVVAPTTAGPQTGPDTGTSSPEDEDEDEEREKENKP